MLVVGISSHDYLLLLLLFSIKTMHFAHWLVEGLDHALRGVHHLFIVRCLHLSLSESRLINLGRMVDSVGCGLICCTCVSVCLRVSHLKFYF